MNSFSLPQSHTLEVDEIGGSDYRQLSIVLYKKSKENLVFRLNISASLNRIKTDTRIFTHISDLQRIILSEIEAGISLIIQEQRFENVLPTSVSLMYNVRQIHVAMQQSTTSSNTLPKHNQQADFGN